MPKRKRTTTLKTIARRIAEGRGQGRLHGYKLWLTIHDVASNGKSVCCWGWKTSRIHHLLSGLEYSYFLLLHWSNRVLDIREQYPLLPLEETLAIANSLKYQHPKDPQTQHPIVMTTDFLITDINNQDIARTIKPQNKLTKRTLQKFSIEQAYWHRRGIDWKIVTENEIPKGLAANLRELYGYIDISNLHPDLLGNYAAVYNYLTTKVYQRVYPVSEIAEGCDGDFDFPEGVSLSFIKHLVATKEWLVNLKEPLDFSHTLDVFGDRS